MDPRIFVGLLEIALYLIIALIDWRLAIPLWLLFSLYRAVDKGMIQ